MRQEKLDLVGDLKVVQEELAEAKQAEKDAREQAKKWDALYTDACKHREDLKG